jgi:hypothetical protein
MWAEDKIIQLAGTVVAFTGPSPGVLKLIVNGGSHFMGFGAGSSAAPAYPL